MKDIILYNSKLSKEDKKIAVLLMKEISKGLKKAESKVWHRHPVWFLDGNPIVGYSKLKAGMQLMFWSGRGFDEPHLTPGKGRFKDSAIMYTNAKEVVGKDVKRWLKKATLIQWDYKNIVKRKGKLVRIK
ncbi:DUF1801 domain-containing protein [Patescibacteria group bacterium]|nr:DUF1801 domain-containing protein [Patescibacteria group bacterium]